MEYYTKAEVDALLESYLLADGSRELTGNLTVSDDVWLGLGSSAGRIEFDDQATDEINFLNCRVGIGTSTPCSGDPDAKAILDVVGDIIISRGPTTSGDLQRGADTGYLSLLGGTASTTGAGLFLAGANFSGSPTLGAGDAVLAAVTGSDIRFQQAGTDILFLDSSGNLGIGATTFGTSTVGTIGFANGTAPSADVANQHAYYSADQAAGNAAPHFRTENGGVVKLYQQAHITDAPGDTAANNATTINAILVALENLGLLATS